MASAPSSSGASTPASPSSTAEGSDQVDTTSTARFFCKQCPKTFSTRGLFRKHTMIHSGECKTCCPLCDKIMSRKDNVIRHLKTKHEVDAEQAKNLLRTGFKGSPVPVSLVLPTPPPPLPPMMFPSGLGQMPMSVENPILNALRQSLFAQFLNMMSLNVAAPSVSLSSSRPSSNDSLTPSEGSSSSD